MGFDFFEHLNLIISIYLFFRLLLSTMTNANKIFAFEMCEKSFKTKSIMTNHKIIEIATYYIHHKENLE